MGGHGRCCESCATGFQRVQEVLVFRVAMVCMIYIPHLLEACCPEEQLPGTNTCLQQSKAHGKEGENGRGRRQLSFQAKTCLRCLPSQRPLRLSQMEADPANKVTTVSSQTGLISIYKLGDCGFKVITLRCLHFTWSRLHCPGIKIHQLL